MACSTLCGGERTMICLAALLAIFTIFITLPSGALESFAKLHDQALLGGVSSAKSSCSRIGIDALRIGGNAADAAVATEICLGVTLIWLTGLGGGGFALVRSPVGSYEFIDFREEAPAAAYQDMYNLDYNASLYGGLASGVPGMLRGLHYIHKTHGKLPWISLLRPSVKLARFGFPIDRDLLTNMNATGSPSFLTEDPAWAIDFAPNGTLLGLGDILTRKRYADLLELIGAEGPDAFYTGRVANATIRAIQNANGSMTLDDLKNYQLHIRPTEEIIYHDFRVVSCGAPAGGTVALSALKTVEGYIGFGDRSMLDISTHRFDEAIRFAYGMRTQLGDPSFLDNMTIYQAKMTSNATASEVRSKISDQHTLPVSAYNPDGLESLETPGTSHISTADFDGMAVSMTTTINLRFGSHVIVPETGLVMNDEMNDFSIPDSSNQFGYIPTPANYVQPGKRPLSSMTPVIVEFLSNRTLYFITGAAGGSKIITATLQSLWHVLDQKMTPLEAVRSPRFHDQLIPNQISFEYLYDNTTTAFMTARGHNVTWTPPMASWVEVVMRLPNGTFDAAAETRLVDSGGYTL